MTKTISRIETFLPIVALVYASIAVFYHQPQTYGFEPKHHGWVSSHVLAIISRADLDHSFVGHALDRWSKDGKIDHVYYDRYPVLFAATTHAVIKAFATTLKDEILVGRAVMNGIFVITMWIGFFLCRKLFINPAVAAAAVLLTFSGTYFMYYKDMVHFDQPAILGCVLVFFVLSIRSQFRRSLLLYLAVVVGVMLGRGYATISVIVAYALVSAFFRREELFRGRLSALLKYLRSEPVIAFFISITTAAIAIAYNVMVEASQRQVGIREVSIIRSATRRLGLSKEYNVKFPDKLNWGNFLPEQMRRIGRGISPYRLTESIEEVIHNTSALTTIYTSFFILALVFVVRFILKLPRDQLPTGFKNMLVILILSSPLWTFPMRNLTAFHDYTTMYYIGFSFVFFGTTCFSLPKKWCLILVVLSTMLFSESLVKVGWTHKKKTEPFLQVTDDFEKIRAFIKPGQMFFVEKHVTQSMRRMPYAIGFYLSGRILSTEESSVPRYVLSLRRARKGGELMTPDNTYVYLFSKKRGIEN